MKRQEIFYGTDLPHEEILQTMVDFDELEQQELRHLEERFNHSVIILSEAFNSSNETLKQLGHGLNLVCVDELTPFKLEHFQIIASSTLKEKTVSELASIVSNLGSDHFKPITLNHDGYYHEDSDFTSYIPKHGVYCSFIHQHKKEKPILLSDGFKTVFFHRKCFMQLKTFSNLRF